METTSTLQSRARHVPMSSAPDTVSVEQTSYGRVAGSKRVADVWISRTEYTDELLSCPTVTVSVRSANFADASIPLQWRPAADLWPTNRISYAHRSTHGKFYICGAGTKSSCDILNIWSIHPFPFLSHSLTAAGQNHYIVFKLYRLAEVLTSNISRNRPTATGLQVSYTQNLPPP